MRFTVACLAGVREWSGLAGVRELSRLAIKNELCSGDIDKKFVKSVFSPVLSRCIHVGHRFM